MNIFINFFYLFLKSFSKITGLTFSFSNDGEDSVLIKYLSRIKKGHYIDIGSHKPIKGSNTFLFYLLGWRGICIDPLPSLKNKYKFLRHGDKFINAGVIRSNLNSNKEIKFYYYKKNTDNSTFDYERVKELKNKFGREPSKIISVNLISINEILSVYEKKFKFDKDIHLLNLDIEGFEIDILNDFFSKNIFPWVICVEEIGLTADSLKTGNVYNLMREKGYFLGARTFLSSIYINQDRINNLPSPYIKELKL